MNKFYQIVLIVFIMMTANLGYAAKNNFQFQVRNYHGERQGGQTFDLNVRYAMKDEVDYSRYPDYRDLRNVALQYLEPSDALPVNTYWEVIAAKIAEDLMTRYPMAGISVQMLVHPNESGSISEPGFHGPIYTIGDVIPLTQVVIPTDNNGSKSARS